MLTESVTILRPAEPVFPTMGDPTAQTSISVDGCVFWPTTSSEIVTGQDTVTWDAEITMPPGTDIRPTDEVVHHGTTYLVVGRPSHFRSPFTGTRVLSLQLKAQTG